MFGCQEVCRPTISVYPLALRDVWDSNSDGSNAKQIGRAVGFPGYGGYGNFLIIPDGKRLAFTDRAKIYVTRLR